MDQTHAIERQPSEQEAAPKTAMNTAISIAACALAAFAFGCIMSAPWPGAVAACGISVLGIGVVWVMSSRS